MVIIYDLSIAELMVMLTAVNFLKFRIPGVCINALTNSADPEKQSDQAISCMLFRQAFCEFQPCV